MNDDRAERQRETFALAWQRAELSVEELWSRYFALGGEAGLTDVEAYVHGLPPSPSLLSHQRDLLAHAVNERLDELTGAHRASYSRPFRDREPRGQPLTALVELLEGTTLAPPDRLPAVVEAAGRALGVQVVMYLVDYGQRRLHSVRASGDERVEAPPLDIDNTLAGQAFRQVRILPAESGDRPRLWVPLLDGAERLGVMEIVVAERDDLYDPGLRAQCRWFASLVGHLVILLTQHGDGLDKVRLRSPRTTAGQLTWSLLPPLTAGVDNFVLAGVVEPRDDVCGDAFDYSLSESTVSLIVLDAVGHELQSGLIAAAAVSAYRTARRSGRGLFEQARRIEEMIMQQFSESAFVTAVLAEVDLPTGRMRYLNAGHAFPLIMRAGKIVKPLTGGRRPPLGVGPGDLTIAEETLEPEDWLVLYTDGITEARDRNGDFFGEERLAHFLRREAAGGYPPPETARRLIRAVLAHQDEVLQDDATVVLARWTNIRPQPSLLDP